MTNNINEHITLMAAIELALEESELDQKWHIFIKRTEATEEKLKPELRAAFTKQEKAVLAKLRRTPVPSIAKIMYGSDVIIEDMVWWAGVNPDAVHVRDTVGLIPTAPRQQTKGSEEAEAASEAYVDAIYTASAWQATFTDAILPLVTLAYKEAGDAAFVEIGLEAAFNVTNPRARKFLKDRTFENVKGINDVTREKLRKALVKGLDAGDDIRAISKRVAGVFDINRGSRTDKIARTEIVGASNNGTHQGYVESEIVDTKIWVDSRDDRVRTSPHNHRLDGEEVELGKRFSNGLLHPHDPSGAAGNVINCRCTESAGKLKETA